MCYDKTTFFNCHGFQFCAEFGTSCPWTELTKLSTFLNESNFKCVLSLLLLDRFAVEVWQFEKPSNNTNQKMYDTKSQQFYTLKVIFFSFCFLVENKMNHVRSSGGTTVQIRASGSQSDPTSVGKNLYNFVNPHFIGPESTKYICWPKKKQ